MNTGKSSPALVTLALKRDDSRSIRVVIASEAKQSISAENPGLLRRCAPRNDGCEQKNDHL
jgi:hypothetical protein